MRRKVLKVDVFGDDGAYGGIVMDVWLNWMEVTGVA